MSKQKGLEILKSVAVHFKKTDCFTQMLRRMTIIDGGDGQVKAELKLGREHLNELGTLHGGFSSSLVDSVTTLALMTHDVESVNPGVSVDLHISFHKAARENEEIIIEAKTLKCGRRLAFLECEIRSKNDNSLLVKGSHTKYVGND